MKALVGVGLATLLFLYAAARAEDDGGAVPAAAASAAPAAAPAPAPAAKAIPPMWDAWREPLRPGAAGPGRGSREAATAAESDDIDVVDAHWMALTMWGEARSGGAEAMRAVGHVIDNRRRAGRHGRYVTETVSAAWQFSCWNKGDPNLAAIRDIHRLRPGSGDHDMWLAAKATANEILAGRSADPTGGALFYHSKAVTPAWSRGVAPSALIGGHLFFRTAV